MRRSLIVLLSAVVFLPGCSTFLRSTHQVVTVTTPGVVGAECVLRTKNNQYRVVTPMQIQIQRSDDTLEVVCKKALYYPASVRVESRNHAGESVVTNSLDAFVGVGYDVASRAIYRYPDNIVVNMELDPAAVQAGITHAAPPEELKKKPVAAPDIVSAPLEPKPAAETMTKALRK